MRIFHTAALAIAAVFLASATSAQGLGDAAAREKEKRKASSPGKPKVITESDLGQPLGPGTLSSPGTAEEASAPAPAAPAEGGEKAAAPAGGGQDTPEGGAATPADKKAAEDERARAEAAWRKKLDQARKEEQVYQDMINRLQLELNDMSGGVYNPGRAARMAFLDENKQKLAETQQRIATLEAEGRSNAYR